MQCPGHRTYRASCNSVQAIVLIMLHLAVRRPSYLIHTCCCRVLFAAPPRSANTDSFLFQGKAAKTKYAEGEVANSSGVPIIHFLQTSTESKRHENKDNTGKFHRHIEGYRDSM